MKKLLLYSISILFILLFSINLFANNNFDLSKIITTDPNNSSPSKSNLDSYMYNYDPHTLGISNSELSYILKNLNACTITYNSLNVISKTAAITDVNFLFKLIKYSYVGFQYFGGSSTFDIAQKKIINAINNYPDEELMMFQLENILQSHLTFLQDSHFTINNNSSILKHNYYSNETFFIYKNYKGYYILNNKKKLYIKSINATQNFVNYLKRSLDTEGNLCYSIGLLQNSEYLLEQITIEFHSNTAQDTYSIPLTTNFPTTKSSSGYNLSYKNKIPIISMDRMYNIDDNDDTVNSFINSANLVKENPILIIDLRGNIGGQDIAGMSWFKNYTSFTPEINQNVLKLNTLLNNYLTKEYAKMINTKLLTPELQNELTKELLSANNNINTWDLITEKNTTPSNNNNLIFILIDSTIASSGEVFIQYLKTLENVILVGSNTSGSLLSNTFMDIDLPNSGINIKFGNKIIEADGITEGIGIKPDIWINDNLILEKVLNLIESLN